MVPAIGVTEIEMCKLSFHSGNSMTVVPNLVSDFFCGTCNYLISNPAKNRISPAWVRGRGGVKNFYCIKGYFPSFVLY